MTASSKVSLTELADQVMTAANEVLRLSDQVLRTSKAGDLGQDKPHTLARCVVYACSLLALQLKFALSRRGCSYGRERNVPANFPRRDESWLGNAEKSVAFLRNDPRVQINLASRI